MLGKNLVEEFITSDYKQAVSAVLENALKGVETSNFEFPLFTKTKQRVEVLLNATARRDTDDNSIVGVVGVGQDITDRKAAEMAATLVAQERKELIDTANAPIFGIDAEGLTLTLPLTLTLTRFSG